MTIQIGGAPAHGRGRPCLQKQTQGPSTRRKRPRLARDDVISGSSASELNSERANRRKRRANARYLSRDTAGRQATGICPDDGGAARGAFVTDAGGAIAMRGRCSFHLCKSRAVWSE